MKAAVYLLSVLFFLVPLIIVPFWSDAVELPKQLAFSILTFTALLFWLVGGVKRRILTIDLNWFWLIPALIVVISLLSAFFSSAPFRSLIGQEGDLQGSVLTVLTGAIFAFLLAQVFRHQKDWLKIYNALFASGFFAAFYLLFSFIPLIGTPIATAVFLIIIVLLDQGLNLKDVARSPFRKILSFIFLFLVVVILAILDVWLLSAMAGIGALLLILYLRRSAFGPSLLLFLSLFLFVFRSPLFPSVKTVELLPDFSTTWTVVSQTLLESPRTFLIGSGPGTFIFDYSRYRPLELNSGDSWAARFPRGFNWSLTTLSAIGVLGFLFYLVLVVFLLFLFFRNRRQVFSDGSLPVWLIAWLLSLFVLDLYPANLTLIMLFWGLTGLVVSSLPRQEFIFRFNRSWRGRWLISGLSVLFVLFIVFVYAGGRRAVAETIMTRLEQNIGDQAVDRLLGETEKADRFSPWDDSMARRAANLFLNQLERLSADSVSSFGSIDPVVLFQTVERAVTLSRRATALAPGNAANWQARGRVYEIISPFTQGADQAAIDAFIEAERLEPFSPAHPARRARNYLSLAGRQLMDLGTAENETDSVAIKAETARQIQAAEEAARRALELKSDYAPAAYALALVLERQGRLVEAIEELEILADQHPLDVGVVFELGILYARQGKYDLAERSLKQAVELVPTHLNARWYLAAIYELQGDLTAAIAELDRLLVYDSSSIFVSVKRSRLLKGLVIDELPEPIE